MKHSSIPGQWWLAGARGLQPALTLQTSYCPSLLASFVLLSTPFPTVQHGAKAFLGGKGELAYAAPNLRCDIRAEKRSTKQHPRFMPRLVGAEGGLKPPGKPNNTCLFGFCS